MGEAGFSPFICPVRAAGWLKSRFYRLLQSIYDKLWRIAGNMLFDLICLTKHHMNKFIPCRSFSFNKSSQKVIRCSGYESNYGQYIGENKTIKDINK